ncbi:class I SAM-dependent methyltransferase [Bosea sp. 2KB_26]|uniref:class I SAM-dependent methyltransferase n=1 Tax=Bosea sp. 2KB_26 TaxID=3237475 RepID=UPI003F90EB57
MSTTIANRNLKDEIRDYWSIRSETFDTTPGHEIFSLEERRAWLALLSRHLGTDQGRRALDLACGTGVISLLLSELGFSVTGLDLSEAMLARARAKVSGKGPIKLFLGDAENTLEPSDSYDAVVTRHLVWTLPDPPAAFAEWHRVLKPGGRVAIIDADTINTPPDRRLIKWLARLAKRLSRNVPPPPPYADTHASILSRVYFSDGCRPDAVAELLRQAGFEDIIVDRDLGPIHHAQGRFMPLFQRLERAAQNRFLISARKPA